MPALKLLYHETGTWKRMLGSMMEENIVLKTRLSKILKDKFNKALLPQLELFQNGFISEDLLIRVLRNEVMELDGLIGRHPDDKILGTDIDRKHHVLRTNIINAQKQFCKLQGDFNGYISTQVHEPA